MGTRLVVIGQGYVGLPLAEAASDSGLDVTGLEVNAEHCRSLNAGHSHIADVSDDSLRSMLSRGFRATTDARVVADADVVVICVPTPLDEAGGPDLRAVESAARAIAAHMTADTLVVLESTTYPGTTENVVLPILARSGLQHGQDFWLAFSPERVDPGNEEFGIRNVPKIVGALDAQGTERASAFYGTFVEQVVPLRGAKEAETAKLLENTYRHVNIALVNEMARFCHDLGIDIWEVVRGASTKPFGFQAFRPGPGVGGHCIPIDPNYLSFQVKKTLGYQFRFVELAQEINNSMPKYVVERVQDALNDQSKALRGARVLLLGVSYKPNISDERESPAISLAKCFRDKGAVLSFHDPRIATWRPQGEEVSGVEDLEAAVAEHDVTVLVQNHVEYDVDALVGVARIFFDTRGVSSSDVAVRL